MTTKEQDEFTIEFKKISQEPILREYEKKNRERIGEASFAVRDAFDQLWRKITGSSYYQPATTVRPPIAAVGRNNTERSDPRSRKYRAMLNFKKILWQKLRRKIGKRFKDLYTLKGVANGSERPIFQNLDSDRLKEIIGEISAESILTVKDTDHGELKGDFNLLVEGYWEVVFAPAKSEHDPVDVRLMWEGQCLVVRRMQEVVLPGFYIEVADNATRDHFTQTPEHGRKKIGIIQEYPYTVLREAAREEYLSQKAAGDAVMREKRARDEG